MEIVHKIRQVIKDNPSKSITDMLSLFGESGVDVRQWYPVILAEYRKDRDGSNFVTDKVGAKERTEGELINSLLENYRDYGSLTKKFVVKTGPHLNFKFYQDTNIIKVKLKRDTFLFVDILNRRLYLNHSFYKGIKLDQELTIRYYRGVGECVNFIIKLLGVSDKLLNKFISSTYDPKLIGVLHDSLTGKVIKAELRQSEVSDWMEEGFYFDGRARQGEQQYIKVKRRG